MHDVFYFTKVMELETYCCLFPDSKRCNYCSSEGLTNISEARWEMVKDEKQKKKKPTFEAT